MCLVLDLEDPYGARVHGTEISNPETEPEPDPDIKIGDVLKVLLTIISLA